MLRVLGHPTAACDGITRRDLLRAGSLAVLASGGRQPPVSASDAKSKSAPAKAVILLDLFGGPSHIDTFDMKPDAPEGIRGEFKSIPTALPGVRVCEHLPQLARRLDRLAVVRSVTHRYNSHNPYGVMTGYDGGHDQTDYFARPINHPSVPSVCQFFGVGRGKELPGYVMLPAFPGYTQGLRRAGPYGGYLGPKFDPVFSTADAHASNSITESKDFYNHNITPLGEPRLPKIGGDLTLDALTDRRSLVQQLDAKAAHFDAAGHAIRRDAAFDLLLSPKAKTAFDLSREPHKLRDRYGSDLFGQSVLLARRLVEAGVPWVTAFFNHGIRGQDTNPDDTDEYGWDTHNDIFESMEKHLLPRFDHSVSAFLEDLRERGLLDSTLVVVMGEFGRAPLVAVEKTFAGRGTPGRKHWAACYSVVLAGAGVTPGALFGKSDRSAAYPSSDLTAPGDLFATMFHALGIPPDAHYTDATGRPYRAVTGNPVTKLFR